MNRKEGKINWRALFAGGPDRVQIVYASDGRTIATDRYSVWNLTAVCEAQGVNVPLPGTYRAMVKELRRTGAATLPADKLAALFDERTGGIGPEPVDRLELSEWSNSQHRPVVHLRTADVRQISIAWDSLPRLGTGTYWVPCAKWEEVNVAVCWGMYEREAFGAVQLVGPTLGGGKGSQVWNMQPHMARALASDVEGMDWEVIRARYPER